jgi:hypothetical protein
MPTSNPRILVTVLAKELESLSQVAEQKGLTLSNAFRKRAKLPILKRGASKGNQRAKGNPGRWKKGVK